MTHPNISPTFFKNRVKTRDPKGAINQRITHNAPTKLLSAQISPKNKPIQTQGKGTNLPANANRTSQLTTNSKDQKANS